MNDDLMPSPLIRAAQPSDFQKILQLNKQSEHFLNAMDLRHLESLHANAAYHRVVEWDGDVVAFLIAFREGTDYDYPSYVWFVENFATFLYIDRIVVADSCQGQGLGHVLYSDLIHFAKESLAWRVTCEFDTDPPNEVSRRFHERFGFQEVGTQRVASGKKRVSLQALNVGTPIRETSGVG